MTKIIFKMLVIFVILINILLLSSSALTGKNIYTLYGKQILIILVLLCTLISIFYVTAGLLGLS